VTPVGEMFHHGGQTLDHKNLSQRGLVPNALCRRIAAKQRKRGRHAVSVLDADDRDVRPVADRGN
jgi:hypothetical protein